RFVFFFQADDCIRDFHVTGVQTCALPISSAARGRPAPRPTAPAPGRAGSAPTGPRPAPSAGTTTRPSAAAVRPPVRPPRAPAPQIRRASCREREKFLEDTESTRKQELSNR